MVDWDCGLHTCYTAGWLYDFQTLITGFAAIIAAGIAFAGPVFLHWWQARKRHIQNADAITYELIHFGSAIAVMLESLVESRRKGDHGLMHAVQLPKLKLIFEDARTMLNAVREMVPGTNAEIMALISWRLIHFRDLMAQAVAWQTLIEAELDTGEQMLKSDEPVLECAAELTEIGTAPFPKGVTAKARAGVWRPLRKPSPRAAS